LQDFRDNRRQDTGCRFLTEFRQLKQFFGPSILRMAGENLSTKSSRNVAFPIMKIGRIVAGSASGRRTEEIDPVKNFLHCAT